jgi:hypothetical protein
MFNLIGRLFLFLLEYSVVIAWMLAVAIVSVYVSGLALIAALVAVLFVWMYNQMPKPPEDSSDRH